MNEVISIEKLWDIAEMSQNSKNKNFGSESLG
jgi:hypothetical protein